MHFLDYLLLALTALALWLALRALSRGKGRCGGGCAACPLAGQCAREKKQKTKQKP